MQKKLIYVLFALLLTVMSCYEDKGNYSYIDIKPITIDFNVDEDVSLQQLVMEDVIDIKPIIKDKQGVDIEDANYEFRWRIDDETRDEWSTRNFKWAADMEIPVLRNLILEVKDKKTGVVYVQYEQIKVTSVYNKTGVLVLSELDNKSVLSFITFTRKMIDGVFEITSPKVYANIYEMENKEPLGEGAIKMHEHFCTDKATIGQHLILQKSGAVDVNGINFKKELTINEIYKDGVTPPKPIVDAMFMTFVDILQDADGQLYSRIRSSKELFHSNKFLSTPMTYNDKVLENCQLILGRYTNFKYVLVFDKKAKKFYAILDGATVDTKIPMKGAARVCEVPPLPAKAEDVPEGFVPLDRLADYDVEYIGYHRTAANFDQLGYSMILKNKAGDYFWEEFTVQRTGTTSIFTIRDCKFSKINGVIGTPTLFYRFPNNVSAWDNILVAIGNKLYIYDTMNPLNTLYLYHTFDSEIVSVNGELTSNYSTVVGLKDGTVLIVNTNKGINIPEEKRVQYELPKEYKLGTIKEVKFRIAKNWL